MRTRKEIKAIGKEKFKTNYWACVLAVLLVSAVLGAVCVVFFGGPYKEALSQSIARGGAAVDVEITGWHMFGFIPLILFAGPLAIGLNQFFVFNLQDRELGNFPAGLPFKASVENFGRKLGGFWWMELFIFLWSLLFCIPGIIKAYSYSMSQYILADCPEVKAKDALTLSKRIMKGHKWELFVFQLSFLGWDILNSFTFGLLELFYVGPYKYSSLAAYYLEVREEALRSGVITMAELEGAPLAA